MSNFNTTHNYNNLTSLDDIYRKYTDPNYYSNQKKTILNLAALINATILIPYANYCQIYILNSGFLTTLNDSIKYISSNNPLFRFDNLSTDGRRSFFITCRNSALHNISDNEIDLDFSKILSSLVEDIWNLHLNTTGDWKFLFENDSFTNSLIMIAFTNCAISIATWMVYFLLFLLPRYNNLMIQRIKILHIYILFAAIYETTFYTSQSINQFRHQYMGNIQSVDLYEKTIISQSNSYNVYQLFTYSLNIINWYYIIYYIIVNSRKINSKRKNNKKAKNLIQSTCSYYQKLIRITFISRLKKIWYKFTPRILKNFKYSYIIFTTALVVFQTIVSGFILWIKDTHSINNFFIVMNAINVTALLIFLYIYLKSVASYIFFDSTNISLDLKSFFKILYNDYHQTIPTLIYNFAVFVGYYIILFYRIVYENDSISWKYSIIRFLKLLITVNVWILIVVFEQRENYLKRETIIGKKITNNDTFYADPMMTPDLPNSDGSYNNDDYDDDDDDDACSSKEDGDENEEHEEEDDDISMDFQFIKRFWNSLKSSKKETNMPIFYHDEIVQEGEFEPHVDVNSSRLESFYNEYPTKNYYNNKVIGVTNSLTNGSTSIAMNNNFASNTNNYNRNNSTDNANNNGNDNDNDNQSVETELQRNLIYEFDENNDNYSFSD
ncbi:hypothetical protein TBLA_0E03260 [Henningerozyma blattae CBS 6284]|uniref:Uncharacterized protein n=1 Tax=Henningerozyma blattae (strain ATCC 34711 / CBS 6284 / DSM 70876 / NBRC 10599 / NRRL Y-10934 / UCD 77-7) TaxID=1071380 RepID=I2H4S8_HENB6|nr:hypothetical protein TBLA_0E03260 [Tetrapisispora blattae CBS 6284]CCH61380.1 hypothetical protein TBLA_0E03260 [Tetrapisispora blattae CBS 6284]